MDTQTQIDRLIELAIIQRTELKQLVEQLPQLREHLNAEVERTFEEAEPQIRTELEEFVTRQAADKTATLGTALEAKIGELAKSLEESAQAKYSALVATRDQNATLLAQAEERIAAAAGELPAKVKDIVAAELARFPRAGEIDQLRKEFAEPRGLNPRGKWQAGESYNKLDLVTINGDSYTSNTDNNITRPTRSSSDWTLVAARGAGGGGGPTSLTDLVQVPTNGQILIGNGSAFVNNTLTAGTGVTITNGSGTITIDATGAQEVLTATIKNAESIAITKGQVVYLFGATGNMASVKLAYNTSDATSAKTFGVVADASISAGGTGTVTCVGVLDGLNLGAYNEGDTLYLGATAGSVTATKPYAPNHLVYVGIVERANNGNGEMYVKIQNGYELDEIHDVQITAPKNTGQTIVYDSATSLWKNSNAVVVSGGSVNASPIGASSPNTGAFTTLSASGNLTVSGTGGITSSSTSPLLKATTTALGAVPKLTLENTNLGAWNVYLSATDGGDFKIDQDSTNKFRLAFGTGNATLAGNLTVSGTGVSSVAGSLGIGTTSPQYPLQVSAAATASYYPIALSSGVIGTIGNTVGMRFGFTGNTYQKGAIIYESISANGVGKLHFALNAGENSSNATLTDSKAVLTSTGRFLLGTGGADSGALLQVGTNTSNSTGGIGFGTDTFLYRSTAGYLILQAGTGTAGSLQLYEGASTMRSQFAFAAGNTYLDASTGSLILRTNGSTTALTLDSSQNATFAGTVKVASSYAAAYQLQLGPISAGTRTNPALRTDNVGDLDVSSGSGGGLSFNYDTSQPVTSYGDFTIASGKALQLGSAYNAGAPTATGYVTIKANNGTTYKVLVST